MVKYFFNRILLVIPTFLGITLLIFALTRFDRVFTIVPTRDAAVAAARGS